jgi:hypothetical protein
MNQYFRNKLLFQILPVEIVHEIDTYCMKIKRTSMWYIIASNLNVDCLERAIETDKMNLYLADDAEEDMLYVFKKRNESLDYIKKLQIEIL